MFGLRNSVAGDSPLADSTFPNLPPLSAHQAAPRFEIPSELSAITESYGRQQLDAVLRDRPSLLSVVIPGGEIERALLKAFEPPGLNYKLAWTNEPTTSDVDTNAQSDPSPDYSGISYVRVDQTHQKGPLAGQPYSIDEILSGLVFELNNASRADESARLDQAAAFETMGRDEYIIACAHREYEAFRASAEFYQTLWLPFCRAANRTTNAANWYVQWAAGTFDQFLLPYPRNWWYPWGFFGTRYDWFVSECGRATYQKAQAGDADAEDRVGYVYFYTNDFTDALAYYIKAADQGNVNAELTAAWQFHMGKGTAVDEALAFALYLKAAQAGDATAIAEVGRRYTIGLGTSPNSVEARRWFVKN